jgi:hypothetical protein
VLFEVANRLRLLVLGQREVRTFKATNRITLRVGDDDVNYHNVAKGANRGDLCVVPQLDGRRVDRPSRGRGCRRWDGRHSLGIDRHSNGHGREGEGKWQEMKRLESSGHGAPPAGAGQEYTFIRRVGGPDGRAVRLAQLRLPRPLPQAALTP